jgi:hypothetical protein
MFEKVIVSGTSRLIVDLVKQINNAGKHLDVVHMMIPYSALDASITYEDLIKDEEANNVHDGIDILKVSINDEIRDDVSLYGLSVGCINTLGVGLILTKIVDTDLIETYLLNENDDYDIISIKLVQGAV